MPVPTSIRIVPNSQPELPRPFATLTKPTATRIAGQYRQMKCLGVGQAEVVGREQQPQHDDEQAENGLRRHPETGACVSHLSFLRSCSTVSRSR